MGDNRYLYPVSRTKAFELKLLDSVVIERLVSCLNSDEALKILGETAYGEYLSTLSNPFDVEALINAMMRETKAYLTEIAPDAEVIGFLFHSEDILNIKRIMKTQVITKQAIDENDSLAFPEWWLPEIKALQEDIAKEEFSPDTIDQRLDRLYFDDLYACAAKCKSDYMISLVQIQADLTNIKTLFRMKRLNYASALLEKSLLPHGLIEIGLFKAALDEPLNQLPDKLIRHGYDGVIRKALEVTDPVEQLVRLEKYTQHYYFEHVKRAKYIAFGVEPLVGYGIAKATEIKWLRLILLGKLNAFPENWIRERLGEVYV